MQRLFTDIVSKGYKVVRYVLRLRHKMLKVSDEAQQEGVSQARGGFLRSENRQIIVKM